jgi:putative ABC transport system permease protein
MIGATTTMYAAVASRRREIGILRALGFSRIGILIAFLLESVTIAVAGGVVGAVAATCMAFVKISMMNDATASDMVFTFVPTPDVIGVSLAFMFGMGLLGGLLPAIRAARTSPLEAIGG